MSTKPDPTAGHTPTPWRISPAHEQGMYLNGGEIVVSHATEDGSDPVLHVLTTTQPKRGQGHIHADPQRDANAAFIVRAVNAHEALVNALEMTQFGFMHSRCPVCAGYGAGPEGKAQGEADFVHTDECPVSAALSLARGEQ